MPSKALLHPGDILDEVRRVPGAHEAARGQLAVQAVLDNRDSIISDLDDSTQVPWLEANDISPVPRPWAHRRRKAHRRRYEELFASSEDRLFPNSRGAAGITGAALVVDDGQDDA